MNMLTENVHPSGLEQLRAWLDAGCQPPIGKTLGINLIEVSEGRAVFEATPGTHVYNPLGMVHGGYAATLLDSACGCAVHASLNGQQAYTSLELKVAYHRPLTSTTGPVRAEGKVVSIGKRVAFAEARIIDAGGRLYASATSTLLVFDRKDQAQARPA
jgi:uncharacterized protein (TIGR00369 family)